MTRRTTTGRTSLAILALGLLCGCECFPKRTDSEQRMEAIEAEKAERKGNLWGDLISGIVEVCSASKDGESK